MTSHKKQKLKKKHTTAISEILCSVVFCNSNNHCSYNNISMCVLKVIIITPQSYTQFSFTNNYYARKTYRYINIHLFILPYEWIKYTTCRVWTYIYLQFALIFYAIKWLEISHEYRIRIHIIFLRVRWIFLQYINTKRSREINDTYFIRWF